MDDCETIKPVGVNYDKEKYGFYLPFDLILNLYL
jgi:hypothetical protein